MISPRLAGAGVLALAMTSIWSPAQAHHSFAMYDSSTTLVKTGVIVRTTPDPWHFQMFFAELNEDRNAVIRNDANDPIVWQIEMETAALMAREGITNETVPPGTIVSVAFLPLRNGQPGGARHTYAIYQCPANTPPAAGLHCDSVEGSTKLGEGEFPVPTTEAAATAP
jgi:hypothetical protein